MQSPYRGGGRAAATQPHLRDDGIESQQAPSDRLRDLYELRAELVYGEPPLPVDRGHNPKFARIWELLALQLPCERFLDAGCGNGIYLRELGTLPQPPRSIIGVDISARCLEAASQTARQTGIEPQFLRANLETLPFPDASFDVVLATQVIEHLLDPPQGMREFARVLAPGGRLVISTDHDRALVSRVLNTPRRVIAHLPQLEGSSAKVKPPERRFSFGGFLELVEGAGLEVVHAETFRFSLNHPLDLRSMQIALNRLDRALSPHQLGDLIAVVARKPD
jgi:2-polyprenyl-3-methyl-5-hydroxy-6-metoxy-1,4-benzoquinol methylase